MGGRPGACRLIYIPHHAQWRSTDNFYFNQDPFDLDPAAQLRLELSQINNYANDPSTRPASHKRKHSKLNTSHHGDSTAIDHHEPELRGSKRRRSTDYTSSK